MKKILIGFGFAILLGLGISAVTQSFKTDNEAANSLKDPVSYVNGHMITSVEIPENLNFAGEKVPVSYPDIYERTDREFLVNTYWQSNTILLLKRSSRYFPIIEPILKEEGIPDDFKYLAVIESGLQNVTSPAGAKGFWQFMPDTAKEMGLEVNSNVDERYHLEKATRAACRYLKKSYEKFGNWTVAAAAYNGGIGGLNNRLSKQEASSYYDILLGEETGRYVFRIIALKYIMETPDKFGYNIPQKHMYTFIPTEQDVVSIKLEDLTEYAQSKGINYKILKIHNPWLRESNLLNLTGKSYTIDIPKAGYYN